MMDTEAYRQETISTWNTDPPEQYQPANAALGIVGEVKEYLDDPGVEELGDVLYYVVTLRRLLELPSHTPTTMGDERGARDLAADVAEATKKHAFHGDDRREEIDVGTKLLLDKARRWSDDLMWGLEEVRRRNIAKLTDRHGESWSPAGEQER